MLLVFQVTLKEFSPRVDCLMRFGVQGMYLAPRWSEMDWHMDDEKLFVMDLQSR